ncbi:MAG TPA: hypothetical protein VD706_01480 [Candidatus Saccharimonadales bacterium]|nr:hypothetical protein [Candidatus Saccharimonadales bacterium]
MMAQQASERLSIPQLANERHPHDLNERDRVFALYYRAWMDEPELIEGTITSVVGTARPGATETSGFVNIQTAQTPDNRTGQFIGIDVGSIALIPETVLPHLKDENFLATWLANGSVAWEGEREMLEETLRKRIAEGSIGNEQPEPSGSC